MCRELFRSEEPETAVGEITALFGINSSLMLDNQLQCDIKHNTTVFEAFAESLGSKRVVTLFSRLWDLLIVCASQLTMAYRVLRKTLTTNR